MAANRGIEDPSVLYLQPTHISSAIWAWSRITLVNPDRDNVALHAPSIQVEEHTPIPPYGARTRSVLGKCVYLVTLAMSLFDLQDVCIAIGSIATLDLPMVVDLIGIYGLKGPYCTLTTTDWFLQALSVIPRGSWGDVARRFTMIRWAGPELCPEPQWLWAHG
ncbi:Serine/threonine protein phosphatase 7 long form [Dorcoceras hygrometricum]|uniref:Serine/threonine protein phosphatase 7 long form n=1 Tax=Dorcoceras hygrometricum TaxID=472368 RepID=A0A2Z7CS09_9LAMI|nr:Serine/threonine protein phosphatase 7 long form [Dorcoceras hygrometricum]